MFQRPETSQHAHVTQAAETHLEAPPPPPPPPPPPLLLPRVTERRKAACVCVEFKDGEQRGVSPVLCSNASFHMSAAAGLCPRSQAD